MTKEQRRRLAAIRAIAPLATKEREPDELGMVWWNSLTEQDRRKWSRLAGNTGRAKDAWEAFKAGDRDGETRLENLPQVSRASHYS